MGILSEEDRLRLLDATRALKWWSKNLRVPLENGEFILFDTILTRMINILESKEEKK